MCNIPRTEKIRALYSLFKLADRAKNLCEYRLANLTFGLAVVFLEDFEIKYEDAGSPLSAYYDIVSISLNGRSLCIPAPLLDKDTLVECLKKGKIVERLEHNRQHREMVEGRDRKTAVSIITSRFFKILKTYFDINNIESALWALDMPDKQEFEKWCFEFLCQSAELCSTIS